MAARYVLCTMLDEAAADTPWGGSGVWGRHSLLAMFHNETEGGEKVFQLMASWPRSPAANRDLLELIYAALALGFEGRYRVIDERPRPARRGARPARADPEASSAATTRTRSREHWQGAAGQAQRRR